tara:strand:+ start:384 stop:533 length:150 start_codon:yes stop_codon:yes gene_type:complete
MESNKHPLVIYIQNWERFNQELRKEKLILMFKLFGYAFGAAIITALIFA